MPVRRSDHSSIGRPDDRSKGWNLLQHGGDGGGESHFPEARIADAGIEDPGSLTIVVVPDHWRKTFLVTEGVGQLTSGELQVIHQVVDALQSSLPGKAHPANDVFQMHPGIDVIAILGNTTSRGTTDEGGDVLVRSVDPTQEQNTGVNQGRIQIEHGALRLNQQGVSGICLIRRGEFVTEIPPLVAIDP